MRITAMNRIPAAGAGMLCLLIMMSLVSCYRDYGMKPGDYDVVATFYDKNYNFGAMQTFSMPDSVVHIVGEGDEEDVNREFDSLMLEKVEDNMVARGFIREYDPENNQPDVIILVSVTSTTYYAIDWWYDWWYYWGWYPGWGYYSGYGPEWSIRYPGYWYPIYDIYSYTLGTLMIAMVDTESSDSVERQISVVWSAAVNGLLNDTDRGLARRIESNINQCFSQSLYLRSSQ